MFKEIKIEKIESYNYKGKVYNFEVADDESFVLNNLVVHNCMSMDGRIVKKDDPIVQHGIFHTNCRGIWVEILQAEEEKPAITGVPNSLKDRIGDALNDLQQLKKPIVKKDSLANKYLKNEKRNNKQ